MDIADLGRSSRRAVTAESGNSVTGDGADDTRTCGHHSHIVGIVIRKIHVIFAVYRYTQGLVKLGAGGRGAISEITLNLGHAGDCRNYILLR